MSSLIAASVILACMLVGLMLGSLFRRKLPDHHTKDDSRDTIKTATGTLATLVALIIGLLVSSAKSSFDAVSATITQSGAKIITLDRVLLRYGPETKPLREQLSRSVTGGIELIWPEDGRGKADVAGYEKGQGMEELCEQIRSLTPKNESQQFLKAQAQQLSFDLIQARWLPIEQSQNTLPPLFLAVLVFWLTVLYACFGLLAPRNVTAYLALAICALSMAGAVFLIMELNRPMDGTIKVSSAPLVKALTLINH
ncbi:hypothetical protein BH11PLA2_BH11PLA2_15510 [soil metagenome]